LHVKLCIISALSLGEKPTCCEAGTESYWASQTDGLHIAHFFMKNIKKRREINES
jgi:hypothetical protein